MNETGRFFLPVFLCSCTRDYICKKGEFADGYRNLFSCGFSGSDSDVSFDFIHFVRKNAKESKYVKNV